MESAPSTTKKKSAVTTTITPTMVEVIQVSFHDGQVILRVSARTSLTNWPGVVLGLMGVGAAAASPVAEVAAAVVAIRAVAAAAVDEAVRVASTARRFSNAWPKKLEAAFTK